MKRSRSKGDEDFFADHLTDLPDQFVECRDMRHAWKVQQGFHEVKGRGKRSRYVARTLKCIRCGGERTDVLNVSTFDRVSTQYHYPEGYQIKGNAVGNRGTSVRREAFRRAKYLK